MIEYSDLKIDINEIISHIDIEYSSVILFGSYARKEQNIDSDIDILVISFNRRASLQIGRISYTFYTISQLLRMASSGSLFIYHVITEGIELIKNGVLYEISENFHKPITYEKYRVELIKTSDLLDVNEFQYFKYKNNLITLLYYLIRSYLYSLSIDNNVNSFSIKAVCAKLNKKEYIDFFLSKDMNLTYEKYRSNIKYLENLFNHKPKNEFGSIEVLIVNTFPESTLLRIFGLRLLKNKNELIEYENLID